MEKWPYTVGCILFFSSLHSLSIGFVGDGTGTESSTYAFTADASG